MNRVQMKGTAFVAFIVTFPSPSDAQCASNDPCLQLKAVAVNGQPIAATTSVTIQPGDTVDAELFASNWTPTLVNMQTYQVTLLGADGAISGDAGFVLPRGWDGPITKDLCPCDPMFPICNPMYGCVGPDHHPEFGSELDALRNDFVFAGHESISAVNVASLDFKWGATINGPEGVLDGDTPWYVGSLYLIATAEARGTFEFEFDPIIDYTFFADAFPVPHMITPHREGLVIQVQCDDAYFCNGSEFDNPGGGCLQGTPPSCDDGVACTIDECDESIDGCTHALNHAGCDDGDACTRDGCTPDGCIHVDDQCGEIPTTSHWGLAVLAQCLLITAKLRYRRLAA